MAETKFKAGDVLLFTENSYEDYSVVKICRVINPIPNDEVLVDRHGLIQRLIDRGYIEDMEYTEIWELNFE